MTTSPALPSGVVPPVCTPLTPDLEVDAASLERLLGFLLEAGVDGVFMLGSTSEVAYLPDRHRRRVLDVAVRYVAGQVPVIAGAIDMTTLRVLDHATAAAKAGCDAVVATALFYARIHPAEVERHFRLLGERATVPVLAYDLPVSVHVKLPTELVIRLAADGVIAGVKDSSGDEGGLRALIRAKRDGRTPGRFVVLTGTELTSDMALWAGADGIVPGLGNVDPAGYVRLARACRAGELDTAAAEQDRLARLFPIVDVGDPARMGRGSAALGAFKAALRLRGVIDCPILAPPQIPLTDAEVARIAELLAAAGLR